MVNRNTAERIIINATQLFDGEGYQENRAVIIEDDMIVDVTKRQKGADYEGIVTPAFIDPHSHIGMFRSGEPGSEQEGNDQIAQITPLHDPLNGVYFDDRAFREAIDFGVLYSCIVPGSGNLFGGKAKVIRHAARHRGDALVHDLGYKMALGYNPRSTQGWKGDRPNTRMGLYAMLEKRFSEVLRARDKASLATDRKMLDLQRKKASKQIKVAEEKQERDLILAEYVLEFSAEDRALLEVLEQKRTVKVHVHKEDDVLYLIDLKKKFDLSVTAEHTGDVFHREVFERLVEAEIPVVYGPVGSFAYKVELMHAYYQNCRLLMESEINFGLMTDHPVIHVTALRDSLKFFLIQGIHEEDALSIITSRNADLIGVGDRLGRIAPGMWASVLVWDRDPLHLAAMPQVVIGEGVVLRQP